MGQFTIQLHEQKSFTLTPTAHLVFEGRQVCFPSVLNNVLGVKCSARFWLSVLHLLPNHDL